MKNAARIMRISRRYQRGQSMTEMAVLGAVLVPLLLAVPLLGKYMDLAQQTSNASRYTAFEVSVMGAANAETTQTVANETRRRFFGNSDAAIKTNDVAGNFAGMRNPLWTDTDAKTFLPDFDKDITHERAQGVSSTPRGALLAGDLGFKLPNNNLYTAKINVTPKEPSGFKTGTGSDVAKWSEVKMPMARQTAILIDSWAAHSIAQARSRVEDAGALVYPIVPLKLEGITLGGLTVPMQDPFPKFGQVDPEVVPCDRFNPPC